MLFLFACVVRLEPRPRFEEIDIRSTPHAGKISERMSSVTQSFPENVR
jgi:hypothetical protein